MGGDDHGAGDGEDGGAGGELRVADDAAPGSSRRRRAWPWALGAAVVAVAAYLAFAVFGVHTLFIDDVVDEAGPVFDSGASADGSAPAAAGDTEGAGAGEAGEGAATDAAGDEGAGGGSADAAPVVEAVASGRFDGVGRYAGAGTATVLTDGTDQRFVRFEDDFSTDNGPDLFVFLGTGSGSYGDPAEYVELGTLRGNIGSQNYEIPVVHPDTGEPIDLERFDHVAVWCKRFDATFAVARLMA